MGAGIRVLSRYTTRRKWLVLHDSHPSRGTYTSVCLHSLSCLLSHTTCGSSIIALWARLGALCVISRGLTLSCCRSLIWALRSTVGLLTWITVVSWSWDAQDVPRENVVVHGTQLGVSINNGVNACTVVLREGPKAVTRLDGVICVSWSYWRSQECEASDGSKCYDWFRNFQNCVALMFNSLAGVVFLLLIILSLFLKKAITGLLKIITRLWHDYQTWNSWFQHYLILLTNMILILELIMINYLFETWTGFLFLNYLWLFRFF